MPRLRLAPAPLLVLVLVGCGTDVLSSDKVAAGAEDALAEQTGGVDLDVTCPDDLEAEVGAEGRCTVVAAGETVEYGVTVTVTSVDGDEVRYDVQVDDEPQD